MRYPGFVGPSDTRYSVNWNTERTINRFVELRDAGMPKTSAALLPTPGVTRFVALPEGPVRGLFYQDGREFAVAGTGFYEIFPSQTYTKRGLVAVDGNPAFMCSNGTAGDQVAVTSGGLLYVLTLSTNAFAQVTDSDLITPIVKIDFIDGYGVVLKQNSRQFQISALEDFTDWGGLDIAEVSESSDNRLSFLISNREILFFGSKTTEPWVNTGAANFPFEPVSGTLIQHGILAPWSAFSIDNAPFWLQQDVSGGRIVSRLNGYTPQKVSTFAIDTYLNSLSRVDDAVAWGYSQEGHAFYCLYLPEAETTICYDIATQQWHERALWNDRLIQWTPHVGRCATSAFGQIHVGSRIDGAIYMMSLDQYIDDVSL